jgi:hypothetical protein
MSAPERPRMRVRDYRMRRPFNEGFENVYQKKRLHLYQTTLNEARR